MKTLSDVESLFVNEILDQHGEYVIQLLTSSIIKNKIRVTDELLSSLAYKIDTIDNGFKLSISFLDYGRFVEIQMFKSKKIRRQQNQDKNESKRLRRAKVKDTRFYTKNVYGSINHLLGRLSSEYSDIEIARLKSVIAGRELIPITVK